MVTLLDAKPFSWDSTIEPKVRYVIIGNGFDLECNLRTSYSDFLEFVRGREYINYPRHASLMGISDWDRLHLNNYWIMRFEEVQIGNRWIDFENEIARVVLVIEQSMVRSDGNWAFIDDAVTSANRPMLGSINNGALKTVRTYRDLVVRLLTDLSYLTRGLEAYLYDYVCADVPTETDATTNLVRQLNTRVQTYVVSFNYTQTLERMLIERGGQCNFCYVHGVIGKGSGKNRMVLGIDERRGNESINVPVEFGPFRKYNQRIYKQTDSRYMDWLKNARAPYERLMDWEEQYSKRITQIDVSDVKEQRLEVLPREVIIFGHSLGITDEDILKSFIMLPNTRTVVYYHNEEAFSQQVSNITAILGREEVITRTGGQDRTLEFRDQREPSSWPM